jgi:DNA-binding response OmpR family regulator
MPEPLRVLVADDAPTVTLIVQRGLEALGWEVTVVSDGLAALEEGLSGRYQLVLLDHLMPGMLGSEILQRWQEAGMDTPTIVLSGVDDDDMVVQCLELGAVDFIRKPFNVRELQVRARAHARVD